MRILLVQENQAFRKTFKALLSARFQGVQIQEASGAREAMEILQAYGADLVVLEITLREENGFELARRIKGAWASPCIVLLSDHDLPEYREAAQNSGAHSLICKDEAGLCEIEKLILSLCLGANSKGST